MDAVAAAIYKATLPANGAAHAAPTAITFSYDTGHDTAAERLTLDEHKMTFTITTPAWLDDDDVYFVELQCDAAATSVFKYPRRTRQLSRSGYKPARVVYQPAGVPLPARPAGQHKKS